MKDLLLKKIFRIPEGVQEFRVLVETTRPLGAKDFTVWVSDEEKASEEVKTNLS